MSLFEGGPFKFLSEQVATLPARQQLIKARRHAPSSHGMIGFVYPYNRGV